MAVSTNQFKTGMCISYNDKMWIIADFQHVKPGKGGAFVRTKLKELKTGRVNEITFRAGEKVEDVRVETKRLQYLYGDGAAFHFMNVETYEQFEIPADFVGDASKWLKENDEVQVVYAGDEMIGVEPPMFVELKVTDTDPGFKGDTASNTYKPATVETGYTLQVPLFINTGDRIRIDTRVGEYMERC